MIQIRYKKLTAISYHTDNEITADNYYKHDIILEKPNGDFVIRIFAQELWQMQAQDILSGDEDRFVNGINSIIRNRKDDLKRLQEAL